MTKKNRESKLTDCAMKLHKHDKAYKRADWQDVIITFVMVIIAVFAFRSFIFEPVKVSGESMTNTLQDGERMFVEKFTYWFDTPSRGDIVICKYPEGATSHNPEDSYVKRIIGLPGETIRVTGGKVYIKKVGDTEFQMLNEDYTREEFMDYGYEDTVIPKDCVFVMGDNRNNSLDSRCVGPIKLTMIIGRVHGVIYPLSNIRDLEGVDYAQ